MTAKRQEVAIPEAQPPVIMTPIERALASGAPPEVWAKMMEVQERWDANQARKAYDDAMASAQAEMPTIVKDKDVSFGQTRYSHATLSGIERAVKPVLAKFGLHYRFSTAMNDRGLEVTCIVAHRAGHSERNTLPAPLDKSGSKNDIQSIGSTQTYLQRYTLMAALGLSAADDDDGKAAGQGDRISAEQAENLRDMIKSSKASEARFLKWAKVVRIEDIGADIYDSCVEALQNIAKAGSKS